MKKTLYSIGVFVIAAVVVYFVYSASAKNITNQNENNNQNSAITINSDVYKTSTVADLGITISYPANAYFNSDNSDNRGVVYINNPSSVFSDYSEVYALNKNTGVLSATTLKEYADSLIGTEYQNDVQTIQFMGHDAYQVKVKKSTDFIFGTFFEDKVGNFYNFYIEQGAPSLAGEMIEELPQSYLDEIEATYDRILNSIEIE